MRTYEVMVTDQILPHTTIPSQLPSHLQDINNADIDTFLNEYKTEIDFARQILEEADNGTELSCHFHDQQLIYTNTETHESVGFTHSYLKLDNRLHVKLNRQDKLGYGHFACVKYLVDLDLKKSSVIKIFKKPFKETLAQLNFSHTVAMGDKKRNPLKFILNQKTPYQIFATPHTQLFFSPSHFFIPDENFTEKTKQYHEMHYLGLDLFYLLKIHETRPFSNQLILKIPYLMICALQTVHSGHIFKDKKPRVHCDVKIENFMALIKGENDIDINVCDIDFCLPINTDGKTETINCLRGTKDVMAPETEKQYVRTIKDNRVLRKYFYTIENDIYSLGVSLKSVMNILFREVSLKKYRKQLITLNNLSLQKQAVHRPSLECMRLIFFYLYWKEYCTLNQKNVAQTLPDALAKENLPILSTENLSLLIDYLSLMDMRIKKYHYLTTENSTLAFIFQKIELLIRGNFQSIHASFSNALSTIDIMAYFKINSFWLNTMPTNGSQPDDTITEETFEFIKNLPLDLLKSLAILKNYKLTLRSINLIFCNTNSAVIPILCQLLTYYDESKTKVLRDNVYDFFHKNELMKIEATIVSRIEKLLDDKNCYQLTHLQNCVQEIQNLKNEANIQPSQKLRHSIA